MYCKIATLRKFINTQWCLEEADDTNIFLKYFYGDFFIYIRMILEVRKIKINFFEFFIKKNKICLFLVFSEFFNSLEEAEDNNIF